MPRHFEGLAHAILRHRWAAVLAIGAVTCLFAWHVPDLRLELGPEALVAPDDDDAPGGAGGDALVVLLEGPDVTTDEALAWQHRVGAALEANPWVERVDGLTRTPLPHVVGADADADVTLDDLEDAPLADDAPVPRETGEALATLAQSDPERFPLGQVSLAERLGGGRVEIAPLAPGEAVDPAEAETVRRVVASSPMVHARLVDAEATVALVAATVRPDASPGEVEAGVRRTEAWLAAHPPPGGMRASLGGLPHVRTELVETLERDQLRLVVLALLGSVLVLLAGFRSPKGVILPMLAVGATLGTVVGAMAWANEPVDLLTNVIPPLLITIGIGDAVHLLARYREEHRRDGDRVAAARRTFAAMTSACLLTSLTTAVGFASLVTSHTEVLRRFGLIAAGGVLVAYVVTVLLLPALLPSFRMPPPRAPRPLGSRAEKAMAALARAVTRSPRLVTAGCVIAVLVAVGVGHDVRTDSRLLDQFDPGSRVARTTALLEARLDGVRTLRVGVADGSGALASPEGLARLDALAGAIRGREGVLRAGSPTDPLHEAWALVTAEPDARNEPFRSKPQLEALRTLVGDASQLSPGAATLEVKLADRGVAHVHALASDIEARAGALGLEATMGGEAWRAARGLDRVSHDLWGSLAIAVVVIFAVMTLLFRSLRLGLVSIPPNALPLVVTLAYMAARDIPLHAATGIVFAVTLGLVVDGTIHVLHRFREEHRDGDVDGAIARTMRGSGRAVLLASATLLVGFASLLFSGFVPIRLFGELSLVAIVSSVVAELVLLPALLRLAHPEPQDATVSSPRASAPSRAPWRA